MARYGMLIDLMACNGCRACMTACKGNHDIPFGEYEGREYYRIWPHEVELGKYPYVIRNMTLMLCMQCEEPPCIETCPITGALSKRKDGIILVNEQRCDGCKACIQACPYGALYFRADKGVVDKCTFCIENIEEGLEPECVRTCPSGAMFFGDLDDPEGRMAGLIKEWDAKSLHPEYGTKPSVYYTAHAARLRGTIESREKCAVLEGICVTVQCSATNMSGSTRTDKEGVFFFWALEVRKGYFLRIDADGVPPVTREIYLEEEYTDLGRIYV